MSPVTSKTRSAASRRRRRWALAAAIIAVALVTGDLATRSARSAKRPTLLYREAAINGSRDAAPDELEPWISVDGRVLADAPTRTLPPGAPSQRGVSKATRTDDPITGRLEPFDEVEVELAAPWPGPETLVADPPQAGKALHRVGRFSGNTVQRRVIVAPIPIRPHDASKEVALTFDDGPGAHTQDVLDILKSKQVPATFFAVGRQTQLFPGVIRRIAATPGMRVENHSWTHPSNFGTMSYTELVSQIERTDKRIENLTGRRPTLLRPPFGHATQVVQDATRSTEHRMIMWEIDPRDYENPTSDELVSRVVDGLTPGGIILLHDKRDGQSTVDALPSIIDAVRAAGYTFVALP